ncbi:MAG TPA: hypothetical protein VKX40_12755 [Aequorivita sp.]|nr:hypothetical protein [Aequorivita sp.]
MTKEALHRTSVGLNSSQANKGSHEINPQRRFLVLGIWLYFLLLIFEGALRKWVLPSLASPLLIVRDPVAIGLLLYAWYYNLFPRSIYVVLMIIITIFSIFTTLFLGHGNIYVTLYGARILLIHFPFVFLMGSVLNRDDVIKIGRVILWIAIPMAVLVALQFYSPQSAWVNRGVGGDMSGAGFSGAMGYSRPPGTFSFTNGTVGFFSLVAVYVFYFWLRPGQIRKTILIAATVGLIAVIPLSISRALAFTVLIMAIFVLMTLTRNPKLLWKVLFGFISIAILVVLLSFTGFLDTPLEVFISRFETAAASEGDVLEGTIGERYIGGMYDAITGSGRRPFFGEGLGMGTNAGSALMGAGRTFLIAEGEWDRMIGEMGAILGIAVIGIRLLVTAKVALASYHEIAKGQILPWMILSYAILIFPRGQWAQPTTLGFSILVMGLLIASFNEPEKPKEDIESITNRE